MVALARQCSAEQGEGLPQRYRDPLHFDSGGARPSSMLASTLLSRILVGQIVTSPAARTYSMGVLGWIIFGLIVGVVARFLMPGGDPAGFVVTAVLGIVGALLGGFLGRSVGWYREGEPAGFVMAVVGAVVLLVLYRLITGRSRAAIRR
jgi:uncharacterized membrane protein YeaQ/YmgE (transglycosylase-associated protein family)